MRTSDGANVLCLVALPARCHVELDLLAFFERPVAGALNVGVVDEDVLAPAFERDEAVALLGIEKLDSSSRHYTYLFYNCGTHPSRTVRTQVTTPSTPVPRTLVDGVPPSDPVLPAEVPELQRGRDEDEPPHEPVSVAPAEVGDVAEVLAVEPDDERREQQDRGDDGQPLHHLVLFVGDLGLMEVTHPGQEIARQVEAVGCAQQLV